MHDQTVQRLYLTQSGKAYVIEDLYGERRTFAIEGTRFLTKDRASEIQEATKDMKYRPDFPRH